MEDLWLPNRKMNPYNDDQTIPCSMIIILDSNINFSLKIDISTKKFP